MDISKQTNKQTDKQKALDNMHLWSSSRQTNKNIIITHCYVCLIKNLKHGKKQL